MQESFWWLQCSDRHIISLSPPPPYPLPPFSPSLISRTVSVDVKHHVYLLTSHVVCGIAIVVCIASHADGGIAVEVHVHSLTCSLWYIYSYSHSGVHSLTCSLWHSHSGVHSLTCRLRRSGRFIGSVGVS